MPSERKYTGFGPADGTGRDWHQFFEDVRAARPGVAPGPDVSDDDDPVEPITITTPAHEVDPDSLKAAGAPGALTTWRNRLLANDWRYKVGHAAADHADTFNKNGTVKKEAHHTDTWWINAIKGGTYITITYTIVEGKTARSSRTVRGEMRLYGDKEMKELVENG